MPTSFTTNLRLSNPGLGDTGWGSTVSNGMIDLVDPAIAGTTTLSADTDVILTTANGMADQARQMILNCTGSRAAQRTITAPASSKVYVVINGTTGGFGVKIVGVGPTTGVVVPAGRMAVVAWNGSDFVTLGAVVDLTASGNVTVAGTLGVGTTSPTGAKVVIEGPASAPSVFNALALRNSLDGSVALIFDNSAATTLASIEALITSTGAGTDDGVLAFGTALNGVNAERMRLDASGNLGIGTTSPTQKLDVKGVTSLQATNSTNYWAVYTNTDNTFRLNYNAAGIDELVLDSSGNLAVGTSTTTNAKIFSYVNDAALPSMGARQDGAGPIQIWQSGGAIERARMDGSGDFLLGTASAPANGASARNVVFNNTNSDSTFVKIANAASGATASDGFDLIMGTSSDAYVYNRENGPLIFGTGNTERARITSGGDFGINGTPPADSQFYSKNSGNNRFAGTFENHDANGWGVSIGTASSTLMFFYPNASRTGSPVGSITTNGSSTSFNNSSDRRLKENVTPAADAGALLDAVQIVEFDWKVGGHVRYGVIAQDLASVTPEAVTPGDSNEEVERPWGVDYSKLVPMLIKEVQSLRARVAALEVK